MLVKTVQVNTFKYAIDSVKDILGEVSLVFHPDKGVIMPAVDAGKKAFVHLLLRAENFEIFRVDKQIVATFDIGHLYKIVKNVSSHSFDTLAMAVEDDMLKIHMENTTTSASVSYDLRLVKDARTELDIPDIDYTVAFMIDAREFARYLRDIQAVANIVKLSVKNKHVVLVALGAMGKCKIRVPVAKTRTETAPRRVQMKGVEFVLNDLPHGASVSGKYGVRYLTAFCKAACLGGLMCMKISQDMPVCCEYTVGSLGTLRFYLCPLT